MESNIENKLIALLQEDARLSAEELAAACCITAGEAAAAVRKLEKSGVICGYTAIVDDENVADPKVKALIEVKITPRCNGGFNDIARLISQFPEVSDVVLVSGNYDLLLTVHGKTLQEVAGFVASKLAVLDGVVSTSTGFILKKYKKAGRQLGGDEDYERLKVSF